MFCHQCGNQIDPSVKFCSKCGAEIGAVNVYQPTSRLTRFANYILDILFSGLFIFILSFILGVIIAIFGFDTETLTSLSTPLGLIFFLLYFILFEGLWGRSVAKFITGSKVVMKDGSKPDLKHIIGRTFARLIPFDALSVLVNTVGWHDSLSGTLVVPKDYTPEQVQQVQVKPSGNRVVIIIIAVVAGIFILGLLASVVLLALNSARGKARNAQRVAQVSQIASGLELYRNDNGSYPTQLAQLVPTYLVAAPTAPTPADGQCTAEQNNYTYSLTGQDYKLSFCLGEATGKYSAGVNSFTSAELFEPPLQQPVIMDDPEIVPVGVPIGNTGEQPPSMNLPKQQ